MSKYPRDEFDAIEENSARHGVHRASMEIQGRSLLPLMIVGVVALCIGVLAFFIMPKMLSNTTPNQPAVVNSSTAPATPAPSVVPTTQAPTTAPVATPSPTPTPTPTPTPASAVDKSVPVAIFNAAGVPGLASRYSGLVTAQGWTVSQSANWAGQPQPASVIFYSGTVQKANAESLSKTLNIPTLVDTAELGIPLAVVLGPGA
ncbi:LytR C-terminal domain-containing protein [Arthrobacter sp. HLT1-20]